MAPMNIQFYELLNFFIQKINNRFLLNGYLDHFVIGGLIGWLVGYLVYKKTINNLKAFLFGVAFVSCIGLAKEIIDPFVGRHRDKMDLVITILGGIIGSGIVILSNKNKTK
jgi:uncharacterized membrane protein